MRARDFLKISLVGGLIGFLASCEKEEPIAPDIDTPVVSIESNKTQYNKNEDVHFTGSATDNIKVVKEGIDIDDSVNSDGTGRTDDDRDLGSLTSTLEGGYGDVAGKYGVTGWAKDNRGNMGLEKLTLIVKPYSQFVEVRDNIAELDSYSKIIK